jgi:hypothetical protein
MWEQDQISMETDIVAFVADNEGSAGGGVRYGLAII